MSTEQVLLCFKYQKGPQTHASSTNMEPHQHTVLYEASTYAILACKVWICMCQYGGTTAVKVVLLAMHMSGWLALTQVG